MQIRLSSGLCHLSFLVVHSRRLLKFSSASHAELEPQGGIDYYSGIENVAIFNAVIYPPLACHRHVESEAFWTPRGCGTYVTHGPQLLKNKMEPKSRQEATKKASNGV